MSKKQHRKQVERARARRRASVQQRRSRRNRIVVITMVALLVVALVAGAAGGGLFGGGDDPDAAEDPDVDLDATEGPCGPTPDDVPVVDSGTYDEPFDMTIDENVTYVATIDTTCGEIVVELEAQNAPIATNNFVNLAREGYYDGVIFHRVIAGFMIQGGDPEGTGSGGPGYTFEDELDYAEQLYAEVRQAGLEELDDGDEELVPGGYPRGTLAMANVGPDTNGSQFFITHGDPAALPGPDYTVFGQVVEGMDVVDDIALGPEAGPAEGNRPLEPVVIRSVTITEG